MHQSSKHNFERPSCRSSGRSLPTPRSTSKRHGPKLIPGSSPWSKRNCRRRQAQQSGRRTCVEGYWGTQGSWTLPVAMPYPWLATPKARCDRAAGPFVRKRGDITWVSWVGGLRSLSLSASGAIQRYGITGPKPAVDVGVPNLSRGAPPNRFGNPKIGLATRICAGGTKSRQSPNPERPCLPRIPNEPRSGLRASARRDTDVESYRERRHPDAPMLGRLAAKRCRRHCAIGNANNRSYNSPRSRLITCLTITWYEGAIHVHPRSPALSFNTHGCWELVHTSQQSAWGQCVNSFARSTTSRVCVCVF